MRAPERPPPDTARRGGSGGSGQDWAQSRGAGEAHAPIASLNSPGWRPRFIRPQGDRRGTRRVASCRGTDGMSHRNAHAKASTWPLRTN